jgi:hypothetical protein
MFGNDIMFTGTITSTPPVTTVIWQKTVGAITENLDVSDQKYSGSFVDVECPKLVINEATFNDRATYQLAVTNPVGQRTSNSIHLTVAGGMFLQLGELFK